MLTAITSCEGFFFCHLAENKFNLGQVQPRENSTVSRLMLNTPTICFHETAPTPAGARWGRASTPSFNAYTSAALTSPRP